MIPQSISASIVGNISLKLKRSIFAKLLGGRSDGRAPDYDDWTTESENGYKGLNGDILVWNAELGKAFELSLMGIRVDESA